MCMCELCGRVNEPAPAPSLSDSHLRARADLRSEFALGRVLGANNEYGELRIRNVAVTELADELRTGCHAL